MAEHQDSLDPWLVAVWPGMGSVALIVGGYLLQRLPFKKIQELNSREFFENQSIEVKNGLATLGPLPRGMFFEWTDPHRSRDLLVFVGEAQPAVGGYTLAQRVLDVAMERGVKRLFTFASMATQLELGSRPRVFGVATDMPTLEEIRKIGAEVLLEGQISGLNGVLLAAGAERGLPGACLLGEMPYFATNVPNPRAAQAVLERFTHLAGIELDFTDLQEQARNVEKQLKVLLEKMMQQGEPGPLSGEEIQAESEEESAETPEPPKPALDEKARKRVETLFERAKKDRGKAFDLKKELDRLGVFKDFEDRFLDLFRKAD